MLRKAAVGLLVSALAFTGSPAEAHTDACAFVGTMTILPTGGNNFRWYMYTTVGGCAGQASFSAEGEMTFLLANTMTGTGVTNTGHRFEFIGTTAVFVATGEMTGTWVGAPDPEAMGSRAIISADVVLSH